MIVLKEVLHEAGRALGLGQDREVLFPVHITIREVLPYLEPPELLLRFLIEAFRECIALRLPLARSLSSRTSVNSGLWKRCARAQYTGWK